MLSLPRFPAQAQLAVVVHANPTDTTVLVKWSLDGYVYVYIYICICKCIYIYVNIHIYVYT